MIYIIGIQFVSNVVETVRHLNCIVRSCLSEYPSGTMSFQNTLRRILKFPAKFTRPILTIIPFGRLIVFMSPEHQQLRKSHFELLVSSFT